MSYMQTIKTYGETTVTSAALGTPRDYDHLFAGVVSAVLVPASAGVAAIADADDARKWGRPPRGTPH